MWADIILNEKLLSLGSHIFHPLHCPFWVNWLSVRALSANWRLFAACVNGWRERKVGATPAPLSRVRVATGQKYQRGWYKGSISPRWDGHPRRWLWPAARICSFAHLDSLASSHRQAMSLRSPQSTSSIGRPYNARTGSVRLRRDFL